MPSWIGPFKPLLSLLLLPPASPLLLVLLGVVVIGVSKRWGRALCTVGAILLWVLSCNATAYGLNQVLLRTYPPISMEALKQAQAIVVLGGGVDVHAPEYGQATLSAAAYQRLVYARYLKNQHDLPLVYSGGKGWAASSAQTQSEAQVAAYVLQRDFGLMFVLADEASRDTRENALHSAAVLVAQGIERIALVTHDWHMQRSLEQFVAAGLKVTPAPMGYTQPPQRWDTDFLPSAEGLRANKRVLHEWLGRLHY